MQTHGHLKFVFKIFIRLSYTKNACSRNYQIFSNIYRASFVSSAEATNLPPQLFLGESLTYYKYSVPIQLMYSVSTQAWHVVLIQQCGFQNLNDNSIFMVRGIYETGSIFLIWIVLNKGEPSKWRYNVQKPLWLPSRAGIRNAAVYGKFNLFLLIENRTVNVHSYHLMLGRKSGGLLSLIRLLHLLLY